MKVLPPQLLQPFLEQVDEGLVASFQRAVGFPLTPAARDQFLLPVRFGGFGVPCLHTLSHSRLSFFDSAVHYGGSSCASPATSVACVANRFLK